VAVDREAALKQAEKLLRQGKLDGAIAEYVRVVEDQPRDWNSINALGDLYVRAGDIDRAVAQFTRIADYLFAEGFLPKAAALYKKALKVKPEHEHTLLRLSEIATRQELLADARTYLRQLARHRRDRGDAGGAAECVVRLASLDESDGDAKLEGARAAQSIGDVPRAVDLFKEAAEVFARAGRGQEALSALSEAAALDPVDTGLRGRLTREWVAAGDLDRARTFLTPESAGRDPDLLLALGRLELAAGKVEDARAAFTRFIAAAPDRSTELLGVADELVAGGHRDSAFACTEIVVDDAVLAADWDRAIGAAQSFLKHGPHVPALARLVELAVDAGRDDVMSAAQAQLADAYLEAGRAAEARVIGEDLLSRDPESEAHANRLRRALSMLGVDQPESIINGLRERGADVGDLLDLDLDLDEGPGRPEGRPLRRLDEGPGGREGRPSRDLAPESPVEADLQVGLPASAVEPAGKEAVEEPMGESSSIVADTEDTDEPADPDILEIDLSETLRGLGIASSAPPAAAPSPSEKTVTPAGDSAKAPDLESVFETFRSRAAGDPQTLDAAEQYERALQHLDQGRDEEARAELRRAARTPQFRFKASARLGRLYISRGELLEGIEWLERAVEAPAPSAEEGWSVLYDLAGALERLGENARALAVLMEIAADEGGYRDVHARIEQLVRAQAGSPRR
jgi:tetratricopeptide (TPR) repeat protein